MFLHDLSRPVRTGLILAGGMLVLVAGWLLASVVAPFLLAMVIAYILNPVVRWLERRPMERGTAVSLLFAVGLVASVVVVVPIGLSITSQAVELGEKVAQVDFPRLIDQSRLSISASFAQVASQVPILRDGVGDLAGSDRFHQLLARLLVTLKDGALAAVASVWGMVCTAFSGLLGLVFVPVLTFYVLIDLDELYRRGLRLVPPVYRAGCVRIAADLDRALSGLLRGQIIGTAVFAVLTTLGLWLIGLRMALLLGPIAGLANLIPYLGVALSFGVGSLIAVSQHGIGMALIWQLVALAGLFFVVHLIDSFFVQPRVIGESAGLHPLAVMFALVIGGAIYGIIGMALAIPATCILKIVARELYHELYDEPEDGAAPSPDPVAGAVPTLAAAPAAPGSGAGDGGSHA